MKHNPSSKAPRKVPRWKKFFRGLVSLNDSEGRIAGGFAIGVVMGIMPTFGAGLVAAAALARMVRCNVAAAMAGSVIGIPFVAPFIWLASCWLGGKTLGLDWTKLYELVRQRELLKAGKDFLAAYVIGNVILTVVFTVLGYFAVLFLVRAWRRAKTGGH